MSSVMTMPVLVLNASYEPVNITRARRALVLLIKGVAVTEETHDRYVHVGLQLPCVIRLRQYRRCRCGSRRSRGRTSSFGTDTFASIAARSS